MFNFHTHIKAKNAIINIDDSCQLPLDKGLLYSIGSHPWHNQFNTQEIEQYLKNNSQIIAIGECGVDKIKHQLNLEKQIEVLKAQIELSEKYQLPLILHIVKSFNEIIKLKKDLKPTQQWIIHGFNSYKHTQALIDEGFYLSFGQALLTNSKLQNVFKSVPKQNFFLETDDAHLSIKKIYTFAAKLKDIELNILIQQINNNLTIAFNGKLVRTS